MSFVSPQSAIEEPHPGLGMRCPLMWRRNSEGPKCAPFLPFPEQAKRPQNSSKVDVDPASGDQDSRNDAQASGRPHEHHAQLKNSLYAQKDIRFASYNA